MTLCFVPVAGSAFTGTASRPRGVVCATRPASVARSAQPARLRMGLGEDGLADDINFAQQCIEEGCSVDAVQDVLTRLEQRRAVLALELSQVNEVMSTLARENLGGDRNLVAQAMEAAVRIFSKVDDDYPTTGGIPSPWTMDKPKRKQSKM
jgi:hypothetical protein